MPPQRVWSNIDGKPPVMEMATPVATQGLLDIGGAKRSNASAISTTDPIPNREEDPRKQTHRLLLRHVRNESATDCRGNEMAKHR